MPLSTIGARNTTGKELYVLNTNNPIPPLWNDGLGAITRDCDIPFGGVPSLRISPQGNSSSSPTNPGRTALTSGAVCKMRIHSMFNERIGFRGWLRYTSKNMTGTQVSVSIYNRDGANAYHFRMWLDQNGNNANPHLKILDGTASIAGGTAVYADVGTITGQYGGGSHTYDPSAGSYDRVGGWYEWKLVVDFATGKYVGAQFASLPWVDLSSYNQDITASTGFAGMHCSIEYNQPTTTSPRFINVAGLVVTKE